MLAIRDWRRPLLGIAIASFCAQAQAADSISQRVLHDALTRLDCVVPASMAAIDTQFFALDGNKSLAVAPCIMGAVNTNSILFLIDESKPEQAQLLEFVHWDGNSNRWGKTFNLMNVAYDEVTKRISATERYRGVGDCGSGGEYAWMNGKFSLVTYAIKKKCDGIAFDPAAKQWRVPLPR